MTKKFVIMASGLLLLFSLVISVADLAYAKQSSSGFQPVTLCHHTHSATNPYVTITVDNQGQLNGHTHHGGDIIPAPAGGCPGKTKPTPTPTPTTTNVSMGGGTPTPTPTVAGATTTKLPQTGADSSPWAYLAILGSMGLIYAFKLAVKKS